MVISPKGNVAVRLPVSPQPLQLEVRLVTDREVLVKKRAQVGPNIRAQSVELQLGPYAHRNEPIYLELASASGTTRFPTPLAVQHR